MFHSFTNKHLAHILTHYGIVVRDTVAPKTTQYNCFLRK